MAEHDVTENNDVTENSGQVSLSALTTHEERSVSVLATQLAEALDTASKAAADYQQGQPPSAAQLREAIESSESEAIADLRNRMADIQRQIDELQNTFNQVEAEAFELAIKEFDVLPEESLKELEKTHASAVATLRANQSTLITLADALNLPEVKAAVIGIAIPRLKDFGSVTTSNNSKGVTRARISSVKVVRADGDTSEYSNLNPARVFARLDSTQDIVNAWQEKAGVDDWRTIKEEVTFTLDTKEGAVTFTIVPKK